MKCTHTHSEYIARLLLELNYFLLKLERFEMVLDRPIEAPLLADRFRLLALREFADLPLDCCFVNIFAGTTESPTDR